MAAAQAIWTLHLLISTALLAKVLTTYQKEVRGRPSACDDWDKQENRNYNYHCSQVIGGVVSYAIMEIKLIILPFII